MSRALGLFFLFSLFMTASCEQCKRCEYTYDVTTIIQTVNGEEEQTVTQSGVLAGPDGETFSEECIKKDEEFTIEQWYQGKADTTTLDNFQYSCVDF